ncbi:3-isopropylmalate dehydrogenase [Massilibacterium senegalense]|uniref:3-isopropylmalate dehydrogenase n=1 Tax=Massilibacterium senegalense TaxID=1632858 RepID=UPI000782C2D9|nr:3-isopropylmalate dehydrogenase [Massilibacterium senegalense]
MAQKQIAVLPGDGIGREIADGAIRVLEVVAKKFGHEFTFEKGLIGGCAIDETGSPLPKETIALCKNSDAVLMGAVGGPKWDLGSVRPEQGLLGIRKELNLFANLRPVSVFKSLQNASTLKEEVIDGVDILIVRELTGGLYFGKPSERRENGEVVVDTLYYTKREMERIIKKAFDLARLRGKKVTSVDKANVLESSRMWRETAIEISKEYSDVTLEHMLVDNCAMQLVRNPRQFDVIVTENLFGDILSDEAAMLTGSLGMLPSASLTDNSPGLYEPVHGSAPDIAGQNKANPLAMILSSAMMIRYSFEMLEEASAIEKAVSDVLEAGLRTGDIADEQTTSYATTEEMIEAVINRL